MVPFSVAFAPELKVKVVPLPAMMLPEAWFKAPPLTVTFEPLKFPVSESVPALTVVLPV